MHSENPSQNPGRTSPVYAVMLATSAAATASLDPAFSASQHTLPNGLTVYLSPNAAEPRIYTQIAVRAGSKHDPDRSTGLAHYLEHMLFKGTDKLGSSNWAAEEPLLQQIAQAYEDHRNTSDAQQRRNLYRRIDALSQEAAAYALPGEYDRIMAQLGARGTNAYTWVDQTVFLNDIPAGELERWMHLEAERFSRLVLRLFHTELETVFEEFNISQDRDFRKVMRVANAELFSPHPYGTHTTIGKGEHLKAPSHFDIYDFFRQHYVPGNLAVILSGDFEEAHALELAAKTFGTWQARPVPAYTSVSLSDDGPTEQIVRSVQGQESPAAYLHWRIPAADTREALVAQVVAGMLSNRQAGLFDQELVRAQRVLSASASITPMAEHGVLRAAVHPGTDQSLAAATELVLAQVARLAEGDFPDWLRAAVLVDLELTITRSAESNQGRAGVLTTAFVHRLPLDAVLGRLSLLQTITDEEVQAFAKTYLSPAACVVVEKQQGDDPNVLKVEKPEITPIPLHTQATSGFAERLLSITPAATEARFTNYEEAIRVLPVARGVELHHLDNTENGLFELLYIFDFGTRSDRWISFATNYLGFLGTSQRSNADVQVDFYRLGLDWQVQASAHRTYVGINGLDKHLPEGLALLEALLVDCQPDDTRWAAQVDNLAQKRRNDRADKQVVLRKAMNQFGRYGAASPLIQRPTVAELRAKPAEALTEALHQLSRSAHQVFYYGPRPAGEVVGLLQRRAELPEQPTFARDVTDPTPVVPEGNEVVFLHLPMVQVEVLALRHVAPSFEADLWPVAEWFNQYYGLGLSSVVFQELRESRALAYSTYAYAETPSRADGHHYLQAFIGTQPDKLRTALDAMRSLLSEWQWDEAAAERVRQGMLQQMRTERDLRQSQYWQWRQGLDRQLPGNQREWLFAQLQALTPELLQAFFGRLAKASTTYLVLGDRDLVDFETLRAFGQLRETQLDEVFGESLD